jgi:hypothetical protein
VTTGDDSAQPSPFASDEPISLSLTLSLWPSIFFSYGHLGLHGLFFDLHALHFIPG